MRKVNAYENAILDVLEYVGNSVATRVRSAVKYMSPKEVVKATLRFKPSKRVTRSEVVLTIGRPNYAERKFVKLCQKAGEPFPFKKVQLKLYPAKKAKKG